MISQELKPFTQGYVGEITKNNARKRIGSKSCEATGTTLSRLVVGYASAALSITWLSLSGGEARGSGQLVFYMMMREM